MLSADYSPKIDNLGLPLIPGVDNVPVVGNEPPSTDSLGLPPIPGFEDTIPPSHLPVRPPVTFPPFEAPLIPTRFSSRTPLAEPSPAGELPGPGEPPQVVAEQVVVPAFPSTEAVKEAFGKRLGRYARYILPFVLGLPAGAFFAEKWPTIAPYIGPALTLGLWAPARLRVGSFLIERIKSFKQPDKQAKSLELAAKIAGAVERIIGSNIAGAFLIGEATGVIVGPPIISRVEQSIDSHQPPPIGSVPKTILHPQGEPQPPPPGGGGGEGPYNIYLPSVSKDYTPPTVSGGGGGGDGGDGGDLLPPGGEPPVGGATFTPETYTFTPGSSTWTAGEHFSQSYTSAHNLAPGTGGYHVVVDAFDDIIMQISPGVHEPGFQISSTPEMLQAAAKEIQATYTQVQQALGYYHPATAEATNAILRQLYERGAIDQLFTVDQLKALPSVVADILAKIPTP